MQLTLFFTRGNSLKTWHATGSLMRETALYQKLQDKGISVSFLTYGNKSEAAFAEALPGIEILYNRWNLPLPLYELLCPWLHANPLRRTDVIKTNQIKGAHTALLAGKVWGKPVIIRQGYIWSKNLSYERSHQLKARFARLYENLTLKRASRLIVTTQSMLNEMARRFPDLAERIAVIPNYVDVERFQPSPDRRPAHQLIYVGRLSEEKNLPALLQAISSLDVSLKIIGSGPMESQLRNLVNRSSAQVIFAGSCPHEKLPGELNQASIFVLPSLYEGHPKALIEAMSCGLAVIGMDVEGVREVIRHGQTGWLCQPDPMSLRSAIQTLLEDPQLRRNLGLAGRAFVLEHYALENILTQELDLYRSLGFLPV